MLGLLPGKLPQCTIPTHIKPADIAQKLIAGLSTLSISQLQEDSIWRDTVALTRTLRTFYAASTVIEAWNELVRNRAAGDFQLLAPTVPVAGPAYTGVRFPLLEVADAVVGVVEEGGVVVGEEGKKGRGEWKDIVCAVERGKGERRKAGGGVGEEGKRGGGGK